MKKDRHLGYEDRYQIHALVPSSLPLWLDVSSLISPEFLKTREAGSISRAGISQRNIEWRGKPQQNSYVERYNRTVRHEWLEMHEFNTIEHAQEEATKWL